MIYVEKTPKSVRLKLDFLPFSIALFRTTTTSPSTDLHSACRGAWLCQDWSDLFQFSQ